ncbi:hypothetical protein T439DRAFT_382037 [Meredithblackwellia eburnea MCA 4105]
MNSGTRPGELSNQLATAQAQAAAQAHAQAAASQGSSSANPARLDANETRTRAVRESTQTSLESSEQPGWASPWLPHQHQHDPSSYESVGPSRASPLHLPQVPFYNTSNQSLDKPFPSQTVPEADPGQPRSPWETVSSIPSSFQPMYGDTLPPVTQPYSASSGVPAYLGASTSSSPHWPALPTPTAPLLYPQHLHSQQYGLPRQQSPHPSIPPPHLYSTSAANPLPPTTSGYGAVVHHPVNPNPDLGVPGPSSWSEEPRSSFKRRGSWTGSMLGSQALRSSVSSSSSRSAPPDHQTYYPSVDGSLRPLNLPQDIVPTSYENSWGSQLPSGYPAPSPFAPLPPHHNTSPTVHPSSLPYPASVSSRPSTSYSDASLSGYTVQGSLGGSPPARFARLSVVTPASSAAGPSSTSGGGGANASAVSIAAAARAKRQGNPKAGPSSGLMRSGRRPGEEEEQQSQPQHVDRRKAAKPKFDFDCRCSTCGTDLAGLLFRGDTNIPYRVQIFCITCCPLPVDVTDPGPPNDPGYGSSLSSQVDQFLGIAIAGRDTRPPPRRERGTPHKKRRADEEIVYCNVCLRAIGSGGVLTADGRESVSFFVEVICSTCDDRYRRCSDCGGGGKTVGVGKWRSKELFPEGRRTCSLSHLRLGGLSEMSYDIWNAEDLPLAEMDEFFLLASQTLSSHLNATLAVPDILESELAVAKTFEELDKLSMDNWALIESMLRNPVVEDGSMRRYLALRWATPAQRKAKSPESSANFEDYETDQIPSSLCRPDKNLVGFVVAEQDLKTGTLFLCLTTPWATGDTFDATTILMQLLLRRVSRDIVIENSVRLSEGKEEYPQLDKAWLTTFFRKDSKLTTHLVNRRGFHKLEDFLIKYPKTNAADFERPIYIPAEYLSGWHILARKVTDDDDWNARVPPKKRRR